MLKSTGAIDVQNCPSITHGLKGEVFAVRTEQDGPTVRIIKKRLYYDPVQVQADNHREYETVPLSACPRSSPRLSDVASIVVETQNQDNSGMY
jgi:hypothetical protein